MEDKVAEAYIFAKERHLGQKRLDGEPYINHLKRVAEIIKKYKESHDMETLICAALLHDILEDTDTGINEIREKFGGTIALLIVELTNDEKKKEILGKTEYLSKKLGDTRKISSWALAIKLADRLDNIRDLPHADKEFRVKYLKETQEILDYIEKNRELTKSHKVLIELIKREIIELKRI
jgi:GTP pyrophosphokinase